MAQSPWSRTVVCAATGLALITPLLLRRGISAHLTGIDPYRRTPSETPPSILSTAEIGDLASLPEVTPSQRLDAAPRDLAARGTAGVIAHNRQPVHVYAAPAAPAIAWLAPQQNGIDTWLPVIDQQPGWVQVLLPSHPGDASGWIRAAELDLTVTPYELRLHRRSHRLQLFTNGNLARSWKAWPGTSETPTPAGRTFLLAGTPDGAPARVLALGMHGATPSACTGSLGTVAIHSAVARAGDRAPDCRTCIRVPPEAMDALTRVRLGSLVRVYR
ncbi:hypothetical protein [Actinoplanes sichuanensis]|uniref:L,D-TPase catalytic domain-containing protein n=1 Tax=Actinoplanes sichuanensis TaxID=512349 RepID=A0ABW4A367_9ACTN